MFTWFKKHFIPHPGNSHRPHFLRPKNISYLLFFVLALELIVFVLPAMTFVSRLSNPNTAAVISGVLASLTNDERRSNDLPELVVSPILTEAAELKANDMATHGYFAHTSPDGKTPWYWLEKVGYSYDYAGENLAIDFSDSKDVTKAWMKSPSHRANIVKSAYREVGTGVATGLYNGRETVFVAQVYANPVVAVADTAADTDTAAHTTTGKVAGATPAEETVTEKKVAIETGEVLGVSSEEKIETPAAPRVSKTPPSPTSLQKISFSTRNVTDSILYATLSVALLALILNIFVKIKIQHPDLITNGLFAIVVIVVMLIANNFVSKNSIVIGQGLDYSREQAQVLSW